MSLPLEGLRVIELGVMAAVPAAAHHLASYGAEVVKVEDCSLGDPLRFYSSNRNGMSAWFANINHGKQSLAVEELPDTLATQGVPQDVVEYIVNFFQEHRILKSLDE